ncbi:CYTH and CHAD domain-containing protein [Magnetospirillum sp. UT-4]|uniref:CYTH and CHAD domain-containing protein n=1 Tax=Magnetospirillum sp. UT-4 TaxID=2681467 RepID=UPI00138249AA|nr:CYTH and CHAD domain-containing protein [Magnetospirillum sp. UT-4]CAA7626374.1 conserved hypothetical protein [Magnetospirillum sp. UT-4]
MDAKELELKLVTDAAGLERIRRHPLVREHRQERPTTARLDSTYYDTADRSLAAAGITVRLRRAGARRLQTVKTAGTRAAGLFRRREWEAPVATNGPDPTLLRATGLDALAAPDLSERLVPVFTTRIRRTAYRLAGEGWEVELALDHGEVVAGDRSAPLFEAELELLAGQPAELYRIADRLLEAVPARLSTRSKSDRGFALAAGTIPAPVKSRPVPLAADQTLAESFRAIARNCLEHLLANEASLSEAHDPEAVHQMRVALRRLRSALKVFRPLLVDPALAEVVAELRWLLAHLGPARDGDVFLAEIIDPVMERHPELASLAETRAAWKQVRDRDFAAALEAVAENRFTRLLLALGAWVETGAWSGNPALAEPVGPFAVKVLAKSHRKMLKAGGKTLAALTPEQRHQVRILGKQLRYAGEFFAPLYGAKAARPFLSALAELQDQLGELNDIAVAGPKLAASHHQGPLAWAAGLVAGWHEARRPDLLKGADRAWKRLRKLDPFWS